MWASGKRSAVWIGGHEQVIQFVFREHIAGVLRDPLLIEKRHLWC
jgi:hypothetical protein